MGDGRDETNPVLHPTQFFRAPFDANPLSPFRMMNDLTCGQAAYRIRHRANPASSAPLAKGRWTLAPQGPLLEPYR